jgi:CheY-like chemotaxis protein
MEKSYPSAILFIDDDEAVNFLNRIIVINSGYRGDIITFKDSELAFDYLYGVTNEFLPPIQPESSYLIFLDLKMPQFNGWNFLNRYLTLPENKRKRFKFVVLSSSIDPADKSRAMQYHDVIHFVSKPLKQEKVYEVLEMFVVGKRV